MANTPTQAPTPSNNVVNGRALLNGAHYVLCYLSLAWEAYAPDISTIPLALAGGSAGGLNFGPMPCPAGVTGTWQCVWGPATDGSSPDGPNLAYVASLIEPGTNMPVFTVVALRGTDLGIDDQDTFVQVVQDLNARTQVPFPYPTNTSKVPGPGVIAQGSAAALNDVVNRLTYNGQTIMEFLMDHVQNPANANPPIVVTGHSLGGCLTAVMVPYIAGQFSQYGVANYAVLGNPFAPPTAGDAAFVTQYNASACPPGQTNLYPNGSNTWINTNDAIPYAWAASSTLKDIWGAKVPTPQDVIDFVGKWIPAGNYSQLPIGATGPLFTTPVVLEIQNPNGAMVPATWTTELVFQHFPNTGYWPQLYDFALESGLATITPPNLGGTTD